MKLLKTVNPSELPEEALIARLRYRRASIDLTGDHPAVPPVGDAVSWVYRHLNRRLRKRLEPFLDLLAMRSLVMAMRYFLAGELPPAVAQRNTLLTANLQRLVTDSGNAETTVARLEAALTGDYPFVSGLLASYRRQGPGGVELQLDDGILQYGLTRSSGVINGTLSYLVDMRNCLKIYKLWHWQLRRAPALISGGRMTKTCLQRIWLAHDTDRLARLVVRLSGEPMASSKPISMEQCLLKGMTRRLRLIGRNPLGLGVIIEYLWKAQLAVHNQVLWQSLGDDSEELLREVLLL